MRRTALQTAHIPGTRRDLCGVVTPVIHTRCVSSTDPFDDPVPHTVVLSLDDAFRVLEAIEDARLELRDRGAAPGLQDELATVIRMLHGRLGFDEGGAL